MFILVTYDVDTTSQAGRTRLRKVAKVCVNHGQRVQNSVFECMLDYAQFALFKHELESIIDTGKDSLRFYRLGNNWRNKVEHFGTKEGYDPEGFLLSD